MGLMLRYRKLLGNLEVIATDLWIDQLEIWESDALDRINAKNVYLGRLGETRRKPARSKDMGEGEK